MRAIYRICFLTGVTMLTAGLVLYVRLVVYEQGSLVTVFLLCMGCLLFFNMPTVIQRRADRRRADRRRADRYREKEPQDVGRS